MCAVGGRMEGRVEVEVTRLRERGIVVKVRRTIEAISLAVKLYKYS